MTETRDVDGLGEVIFDVLEMGNGVATSWWRRERERHRLAGERGTPQRPQGILRALVPGLTREGGELCVLTPLYDCTPVEIEQAEKLAVGRMLYLIEFLPTDQAWSDFEREIQQL